MVGDGPGSVGFETPTGTDVRGFRPSDGRSAGAANDFGCANLISFKCLISKRFSPDLKVPTSNLTVDLDGLSTMAKGPS